MRRSFARSCSLVAVAAVVATVAAAAPPPHGASPGPPGQAVPPVPPKESVATGHGGAVASVDRDASAAGLEVLRRGGNAADAAVATAAALGVTEPYSSGIGGGGYFVHYDARSGQVRTVDGRETAPLAADRDLFLEDGEPLSFDEAVNSGLSVGTPGTPATWDAALRAWGSRPLADLLEPAEKLAREGFTVDDNFRDQTASNEERFADFPDTAELFLPDGELPVVGSTLKNPDLADTYRRMADKGVRDFYRGPVARDIVRTVNAPRVDPDADRTVRPGELSLRDLRRYATKQQRPSHTRYRGLDIHSMAPSSSGGTTVGEALNILESTGELSSSDETAYRHRSIEASRIAFADRGRWVGDPAHERVPTRQLLSQRFADSRACLLDDDAALTSPLAPGNPYDPQDCDRGTGTPVPSGPEGVSTTHLTTSDRWGNVVAYTLTIESTGGSAMTVPGRGFLLNNELTDFNFEPVNPEVHDPNLPGPGKRPRSSMAPTIVLERGSPVLAVGSPGGATIITTVLQLLTGVLDRGQSLPEAINAPRASQRDTPRTDLEPELWDSPVRVELEALGHEFSRSASIGRATGIQRLPGGKWLAAAEKTRGGGGSAMMVHPDRR
ncbi:gamma-glutamyltransferase [Streptomyces sp. P38-E01]|uniref:Glutathione hydrolase proenzyme n=1 Tax=Streptomyces tardus TaxID=2780544 RepID=A0A949JDU6_9ACTN|nr:gamma-glutamyltransferase [Streptomyces tardus]MBU7598106.1 gamma-glutamyltransferase [Streptomyces tardus]